MESDLNMYLEFYGLPGCGKSTISHSLAEALRSRGEVVSEPTYDTDHRMSPLIRKLKKGSGLLGFIVFQHSKWRTLETLIKDNGNSGGVLRSLGANIVSKLSYYNENSHGYVILDEGITQSSISLVNNGLTSIENEQTLYELCEPRSIKKIYVKVTSDIALKRMNERAAHDSRIEKIADPVEREKELKRIEKECETVVPDLILEGLTVEESVKMIMEQII